MRPLHHMLIDLIALFALFAAAMLVANGLIGCAMGRVTPDGYVQGIAIGHAKLEACAPPATPGEPCACPNRIAGGALSKNAYEVAGVIASALVAILAGGVAF